ncbi:hypothetical protein [Pandoraea sp.]|uniref:hypothetical protein n=1 Tax=Pandoraea sp. TaxID=1883445 RepID=UPI00121FB88C|nr:hypothetical protein [Pandoraea sp.]TAL56907.1 MAG: hypothetical protein EPN80_01790 [Pandoraea sp.]TAM17701.1 MAG: hypothetical protein EPN65_09790 [Pandoraea sp.]
MLIRRLLIRLCSWPEQRVMLRQLKRHVEARALDQHAPVTDRRITRRLRMAFVWSVLQLQADQPGMLAAGLAATTGLIVVWALRWAGWLY